MFRIVQAVRRSTRLGPEAIVGGPNSQPNSGEGLFLRPSSPLNSELYALMIKEEHSEAHLYNHQNLAAQMSMSRRDDVNGPAQAHAVLSKFRVECQP